MKTNRDQKNESSSSVCSIHSWNTVKIKNSLSQMEPIKRRANPNYQLYYFLRSERLGFTIMMACPYLVDDVSTNNILLIFIVMITLMKGKHQPPTDILHSTT